MKINKIENYIEFPGDILCYITNNYHHFQTTKIDNSATLYIGTGRPEQEENENYFEKNLEDLLLNNFIIQIFNPNNLSIYFNLSNFTEQFQQALKENLTLKQENFVNLIDDNKKPNEL